MMRLQIETTAAIFTYERGYVFNTLLLLGIIKLQVRYQLLHNRDNKNQTKKLLSLSAIWSWSTNAQIEQLV